MATSTTAAADVTGSDLEALALEDIYAAALPPADHLLPPRSLLQDGRAWEQLLVPAEQLCEVSPRDRRTKKEEWRVHDGRPLQAAGLPPEVETKEGWPPDVFTVAYATNAGPRRLCIISGRWGNSARGGEFGTASKARQHAKSAQAAAAEQARRKDAAIDKAQRKGGRYFLRRGTLSHTTGSSRSSQVPALPSSLPVQAFMASDSSNGGGSTGGSNAAAGDRGARGTRDRPNTRAQKRRRGVGGDGGQTGDKCKPARLQNFNINDMIEAQDSEGDWYRAVTRGNSNMIHYVGWPRAFDEEFTATQMQQRTRVQTGKIEWQTPLWPDRAQPYEIIVDGVAAVLTTKLHWLNEHTRQQEREQHGGGHELADDDDDEPVEALLQQGTSSHTHQQGSREGPSALSVWDYVPWGEVSSHQDDMISYTGLEAEKKTHSRMDALLGAEYFEDTFASTPPEYDENSRLRVNGDPNQLNYVYYGAHSLGTRLRRGTFPVAAMARRREHQPPEEVCAPTAKTVFTLGTRTTRVSRV